MKDLFFGSLMIFMLISCGQREYSFTEQEISVQRIQHLNGFISKTGIIQITQNYIVSHDIYSMDTLFTLIDKNNFKIIRKFAPVGRGPNEISRSGFYHLDKYEEILYLYDAGKSEMVSYDLQQPEIKATSVRLSKEIPTVMGFGRIGSGEFITQNFVNPEHASYIRFNTKTNDVSFFGEPFYAKEELVFDDYYNQYYNRFAIHPTENLLVRAFDNYDLIQLINFSGNTVSEYKGPNYSLLSATKNWQGHYRTLRTTANYLYADYVDGSRLNSTGQGINRPYKIRIFNWDLQPIALLKVDVPIISFDVDLQNKRIVIFTEDESRPFVYFEFDEQALFQNALGS